MESIQKHWSNIVTIGYVVVVAFVEAWQQAAASASPNVSIPRLEGSWNYLPLLLLVAAGISWLVGRRRKANTSQRPVPQPPETSDDIPALSVLLGQTANITFDPKQFFAMAHHSPITAEAEKNMRTVAQRNFPNEKEGFYSRFIGVGLVAHHYDLTWFVIYGSQLAALAELNSRGLIPVPD